MQKYLSIYRFIAVAKNKKPIDMFCIYLSDFTTLPSVKPCTIMENNTTI